MMPPSRGPANPGSRRGTGLRQHEDFDKHEACPLTQHEAWALTPVAMLT
jgi:hypothetical protein